jgi:CheY-like chemotaxis protein
MSRKKVLIVDDNIVIVKTLSMKLTAQGYEVVTALDGGEAVSTARREKPDLILLDISFPPDVGHGGGVAWDGFLIMSWLQRLEEAKHIPIIVITGGDPAKLKERALAAGAISFFRKPINPEELLAVMARTLGTSVGQPQAPAAPAGQPAV